MLFNPYTFWRWPRWLGFSLGLGLGLGNGLITHPPRNGIFRVAEIYRNPSKGPDLGRDTGPRGLHSAGLLLLIHKYCNVANAYIFTCTFADEY